MSESSVHVDKVDDNPRPNANKVKSEVSARRARERELERKRARGEISCAECRRLKLKCNKKVPCASCIRRGCHTICPNGLLTAGQGSRFVLANTDKLHSKLVQMSQRIRELEDALQIAQSSLSKSPHHLLSEELLAIKSGVDGLNDDVNRKEEQVEEEEEEEIAVAFGTLSVSECGATRFVGQVAAETFLMNEPIEEVHDRSNAGVNTDSDTEQKLPDVIIDAAKNFPLQLLRLPREELYPFIIEHLPTYERATALAEAFLENTAWLPRPIERSQIMEHLFPLIYKGKHAQPETASMDDNGKYKGIHGMHNLALTLAVFACGACGDLTLAPHNPEGKLYHTLALAALSGHPIIGPGGASLETVQAIVLIAQYDFYSGDKSTLESAWKTISLGLIVAASIGLHRDPAHWNMDPKYMQRRRYVFWEIFSLDKWKSLGTGRPSIFHMQEIDCEFPEDLDAFIDSNGKRTESPSRWRHRFVKEVIGPVSEHLCLTRPIKYSEILHWDRKLREFDDTPMPPNFLDSGSGVNVKGRMWVLQKEIGILALHRNFFARAMIKNPENPLRSPFAPSFLAAYACSIKILRNMRLCFDQNKDVVIRLWPLWTHCLTAGVILGSVASNTSQAPLAKAAFHDLELAVRLFEDSKTVHPVARRGLPILLRLYDRARAANAANENATPSGIIAPKMEQDEMDELAILRGSARLVHRKTVHAGSPSRWNSNDGHGTPTSTTSYNSSPSPMSQVESGSAAMHQHVVSNGMPFASDGIGIPFSSGSSGMLPEQTQPTVQPTSDTLTSDIAALFNAIYSTPIKNPSLASTVPSNINAWFEQQSKPSDQPLPHYVFGSSNPQSSGTSNSSPPPFMSPNDSWITEAARLESMLSGAYGSPPMSFDPASSVRTAAPSYDLAWLSANEPGMQTEFTNDAVQFMEDWRLQASIEGSNFLTEPGADVKMSF